MKTIIIKIEIPLNIVKRVIMVAVPVIMLLGAGIIFTSTFSEKKIEISGEFRAPVNVTYVKGGNDGVVTAIHIKWTKNELADRTYVIINMNGFPKILDDGLLIYKGSDAWVTFSDSRYLNEKFYVRLWSWNAEFGLSEDYFDLVIR